MDWLFSARRLCPITAPIVPRSLGPYASAGYSSRAAERHPALNRKPTLQAFHHRGAITDPAAILCGAGHARHAIDDAMGSE
jgi:hypothetical protein